MLSQSAVDEFRNQWLPNASDCGLKQLGRLLDRQSPQLIRNAWSHQLNADPAGCLATQIAWLHPKTSRLHEEAGYRWLREVAGVTPEESHILREWDGGSRVEAELAYLVREELQRRDEARREKASSFGGRVRSLFKQSSCAEAK